MRARLAALCTVLTIGTWGGTPRPAGCDEPSESAGLPDGMLARDLGVRASAWGRWAALPDERRREVIGEIVRRARASDDVLDAVIDAAQATPDPAHTRLVEILDAIGPTAVARLLAREAGAKTPGGATPWRTPGVNLEVQLVVAKPEVYADVFRDGVGAEGARVAFVPEALRERCVREVREGAVVHTVTGTKITVYDRQRAAVETLNEIAYVRDYEGADPVVEHVKEGVSLHLTPTVAADHRHVTIEIECAVRELVRPIRTREVLLDDGARVKIQIPRTRDANLRSTVTVPQEGTVLLDAGKPPDEEGNRLFAFVTAQAIDLGDPVPYPRPTVPAQVDPAAPTPK